MDFQPQIKYILPTGMPMPYFMTYPDYPGIKGKKTKSFAEEGNLGCMGMENPGMGYLRLAGQAEKDADRAVEDFEYLRKTYPTMVGRYQRRVEEILEKLDYAGSMIYDEYPDRISLQKLGDAVAEILAKMNASDRGGHGGNAVDDAENPALPTALEEAYLQGLAQVLVCNEIYRRRRKKRMGS